MNLTKQQITDIAKSIKVGYAAFMAFIEVESNGEGFKKDTGRIVIQFEPSYFKKTYTQWRKATANTVWLNNGVGNQTVEWKAFNDAYKISPDAAMQSCSIGLGQIMGYHYKMLGFKTVGDMWDFAKGYDCITKTYDSNRGEYNQVILIARFIAANATLLRTLQKPKLTIADFDIIAKNYNGAYYKELALKIGREPYDKTMLRAYNKYAA
jgi:hypothetical protein